MPIDEDVDVPGNVLEKLLAFLGLDVERYAVRVHHFTDELHSALLPGLLVLEHVLFPTEGGQLPQRIALGRFDADHLGPASASREEANLCPILQRPMSRTLNP